MAKCTHCHNCGIERTKENWRPAGILCAKCFYEVYAKQNKIKRNAEIKSLATEIVKQYNRKTYTGLLCACRDLVKFYNEHNIKILEDDENGDLEQTSG